MSKKLHGNGLWSSSRMMLPEHKETIIRHRTEVKRKFRPALHEDEWEIVFQNIHMSKSTGCEIEVRIFGEYEDKIVKGVVTRVNQHEKRFRLDYEDDYEWIRIPEILQVTTE